MNQSETLILGLIIGIFLVLLSVVVGNFRKDDNPSALIAFGILVVVVAIRFHIHAVTGKAILTNGGGSWTLPISVAVACFCITYFADFFGRRRVIKAILFGLGICYILFSFMAAFGT